VRASTDAERWLELADEMFTTATNIDDVFDVSDDEEKRKLILCLGLN
jgi:hypothetical protein